MGRSHEPSFRLILADSRNAPKSGKCLEILGFYNARKGGRRFESERIKFWISKGAQISETVRNLLLKEKIIEGSKKKVR